MEGRDIPGYYYDKEKKKYFKIRENTSAGSAYSSQDIKRRKLRDEKNVERAEAQARQQGRIRRAEMLHAPLVGCILQREIEHCRRYRLDGARIYSQGLLPRGRLLPAVTSHPLFASNHQEYYGHPLFALNHRPDYGQSIFDINLVYNDHLLTARVNGQFGGIEDFQGLEKFQNSQSQGLLPSPSWTWALEVFGNPGPATSLSTRADRGTVAVTWLSGSSNSGIAIVPRHAGDSFRPAAYTEAPIVVLGPGVARGPQADIFSSAPAPSVSPLAFAFGSSYGILVLNKDYGSLSWVNSDRFPRHKSPKDVFALEFSADNHNILLSGCRKGILNITDLRVPTRNSDIVNHPSTITHIRQLDKDRIIVAGLNSSLYQYDLRFLKETTNLASTPRLPNKSFHNRTITYPILQYPDFHNDSSIQMGFDVDLETGTVVAAQEKDDFHPPLRLFSLHGGHEVTVPEMPLDFKNGPNVRCAKFFEDIEGRAKSLYVGGNFIQRFAWTGIEEDP